MKNLKETILDLVKKVDDSKTVLEEAESQLFSIAEETAKTFYLAARDYGNSSEFFGDEYRVNSGGFEEFRGIIDDTLTFTYNDYCYGEDHYAHVKIPLAWFEDGALESYVKECKMRKIKSLKYEIEQLKMDLYDLDRFLFRLKDVDCDFVFTNDGSVEYKEFIKQFKWYQRDPSILSNYYIMALLKDGVNKFIKK